MKAGLLFFLLTVFTLNSFSQIVFEEHIVDELTSSFSTVYSFDVDGDGDEDLIAEYDHSIVWYKNTWGYGEFSPQQIIFSPDVSWDYAKLLNFGDIDGDGVLDIIYSDEYGGSGCCRKINWLKNEGNGEFIVFPHFIGVEYTGLNFVDAKDIDGDGDTDVIATSLNGLVINWYENFTGEGHFDQYQTIANSTGYGFYGADVDSDGDMDVRINNGWYENTDGLGSFGDYEILINISGNYGVTASCSSDLDGDGDDDIITGMSMGEIRWYKNIDGQGNFNLQQIITTNTISPWSVIARDIDNDGDMDILSASSDDHIIAWYENLDGLGSFGSQNIITSNARGYLVSTGDMDGDGDLDVMSAYGDNKIAWYENSLILAINENNSLNFSIYPNPTTGILNIASEIRITSLEIYNQLGQLVLFNVFNSSIDISELSQGMYFIKIVGENGVVEVKKVINE